MSDLRGRVVIHKCRLCETSVIEGFLYFSTGKKVGIIGDFNLPSISWSNSTVDLHITNADALFFNLFTDLGLHQHFTEPTFLASGNTLDLVLTSDHDRITEVSIYPLFPCRGHTLIKFSYLFLKTSTQLLGSLPFGSLTGAVSTITPLSRAQERYLSTRARPHRGPGRPLTPPQLNWLYARMLILRGLELLAAPGPNGSSI